MSVHDAMHQGQPDTVATENAGLVQALKRHEKFVCVSHVETNAVVSHYINRVFAKDNLNAYRNAYTGLL